MSDAAHHLLPLWRRNSIGETAKKAAQVSDRRTLRQRVLDHLSAERATPETILAKLRGEGVKTVLTSVRPRCSELARLGLIADSGERGTGEGGCKAIVWRVTTADERAAYAARKAAEGAE